MKQLSVLIAVFVVSFNTSFAKGSCGGHGCGGHGGVAVGAHHNPFDKIDRICFPGYVVYMNDTVKGNVSVKDEKVKVDIGLITKQYKMSDKGLQSIYLNNNDQVLFMTHLDNKGKKFYRLLHMGKLSLYDDRYDFSYKLRGIDVGDMMLAYSGKVEPLDPFPALRSKKRLVASINKVYGMNLDYKEMKWEDVVACIHNLDKSTE